MMYISNLTGSSHGRLYAGMYTDDLVNKKERLLLLLVFAAAASSEARGLPDGFDCCH